MHMNKIIYKLINIITMCVFSYEVILNELNPTADTTSAHSFRALGLFLVDVNLSEKY